MDRQECLSYNYPPGNGDCFKYAATPIIADIIALTAAMASVECSPACRLKCAGSIPTAANPVITPLAPPAIPAAAIPFTQVSQIDIFSIHSRRTGFSLSFLTLPFAFDFAFRF
jgi:hypothetical protein